MIHRNRLTSRVLLLIIPSIVARQQVGHPAGRASKRCGTIVIRRWVQDLVRAYRCYATRLPPENGVDYVCFISRDH